jgi:hypothetical protein
VRFKIYKPNYIELYIASIAVYLLLILFYLSINWQYYSPDGYGCWSSKATVYPAVLQLGIALSVALAVTGVVNSPKNNKSLKLAGIAIIIVYIILAYMAQQRSDFLFLAQGCNLNTF